MTTDDAPATAAAPAAAAAAAAAGPPPPRPPLSPTRLAAQAPADTATASPPDPRFVGPPVRGESILVAAQRVLRAASPAEKAALSDAAYALFTDGGLALPPAAGGPPLPADLPPPPSKPARDGRVTVLPPGKVKRLKAGGTPSSRAAILHALAHIENWAIDLFYDIIARFGGDPAYPLPAGFYTDFMRGAAEETAHFRALERRLVETGFEYGSFSAHDGLWESAAATAGSLPARLAVEHCVHEARGLDTLPATLAKFRNNGDEASVVVLEGLIYPEEITHCASGVRWLTWLHSIARGEGPAEAVAAAAGAAWAVEAGRFEAPQLYFHHLVRSHFKGSLKPPFNVAARNEAGFDPSWYQDLATPPGGSGVAGAPGSRAGPKEGVDVSGGGVAVAAGGVEETA